MTTRNGAGRPQGSKQTVADLEIRLEKSKKECRELGDQLRAMCKAVLFLSTEAGDQWWRKFRPNGEL